MLTMNFLYRIVSHQELGVNCIELMPCQEFNELEYYAYNSVLGDYKYINTNFLINVFFISDHVNFSLDIFHLFY